MKITLLSRIPALFLAISLAIPPSFSFALRPEGVDGAARAGLEEKFQISAPGVREMPAAGVEESVRQELEKLWRDRTEKGMAVVRAQWGVEALTVSVLLEERAAAMEAASHYYRDRVAPLLPKEDQANVEQAFQKFWEIIREYFLKCTSIWSNQVKSAERLTKFC